MRGRLGAAERTAIPVQSSDCALGEVFRGVAHVLLWFAVVAFDVIKMAYAQPSVYRENRFSVDLRENPMFAGVKQGSDLRNVGLAVMRLSVLGKGGFKRHRDRPIESSGTVPQDLHRCNRLQQRSLQSRRIA